MMALKHIFRINDITFPGASLDKTMKIMLCHSQSKRLIDFVLGSTDPLAVGSNFI